MTTENPPSIPASRRARHRRSVIARPAPAQHHHRLHVAPIPHPSRVNLAPGTPAILSPGTALPRSYIRFVTVRTILTASSTSIEELYTFSTITRPFPIFFTTDPHPLSRPTAHIQQPTHAFFATVLDLFVAVLHLFAAAHRLRALFDSVSLFFCSAPHSSLPLCPLRP